LDLSVPRQRSEVALSPPDAPHAAKSLSMVRDLACHIHRHDTERLPVLSLHRVAVPEAAPALRATIARGRDRGRRRRARPVRAKSMMTNCADRHAIGRATSAATNRRKPIASWLAIGYSSR